MSSVQKYSLLLHENISIAVYNNVRRKKVLELIPIFLLAMQQSTTAYTSLTCLDPRSCPPSHLLFNIAIVCLVLYLVICTHVGGSHPGQLFHLWNYYPRTHNIGRCHTSGRCSLTNNKLISFHAVAKYLDANAVVNAAE